MQRKPRRKAETKMSRAKKNLSLLLSFVLVLGLFGCVAEVPPSEEPKPDPALKGVLSEVEQQAVLTSTYAGQLEVKTLSRQNGNTVMGVHYPVTGMTAADADILAYVNERIASFDTYILSAGEKDFRMLSLDFSVSAYDDYTSVTFNEVRFYGENAREAVTICRTYGADGTRLTPEELFIKGKRAKVPGMFGVESFPEGVSFRVTEEAVTVMLETGDVSLKREEIEKICLAYSARDLDPDGKMIAITYDDGPSSANTGRLLDGLKERGVLATFFMVGTNVSYYPKLVRRIAEEGHCLGNHSYDHPQFTKIGAEKSVEQVEKTSKLIEDACGKRPLFVRPPYCSTNEEVRQALEYTLILWSVDPEDWKYRDVDTVREHIVDGAHDGAIVLVHDIHSTSVEGSLAAIDILLEEGYQFVTVEELFLHRDVEPVFAKHWYSVK